MASNPGQAGTIWTRTELLAGWNAIAHVNPTTDAAVLNAQTYVGGPFDLQWSQIKDIFMGGGAAEAVDWGKLTQVANAAIGATLPGGGTQTATIQAAAIAFQQCASMGGVLRASDANIWAVITAGGTLLSGSTVGALTAATVTAVVALRSPTLPVWYTPISAADIIAVTGQSAV